MRHLLDGRAVGARQPAAGTAVPQPGTPGSARIARRRLLKAAVLGQPGPAGGPPARGDGRRAPLPCPAR